MKIPDEDLKHLVEASELDLSNTKPHIFGFGDNDYGMNKGSCPVCAKTVKRDDAFTYTNKFVLQAYEFYQRFMACDDVESKERQKSPFYDEEINQTVKEDDFDLL